MRRSITWRSYTIYNKTPNLTLTLLVLIYSISSLQLCFYVQGKKMQKMAKVDRFLARIPNRNFLPVPQAYTMMKRQIEGSKTQS